MKACSDVKLNYLVQKVLGLLGKKQDILTFDDAVAEGSTNAVTSGVVYDELTKKQDTLVFDVEPTEGSANAVTSGVVYNELTKKQDSLVFDTEPTEGSTNAVTSGVVYNGIAEVLSTMYAQPTAKIAVGTYTGTGTAGEHYPCSLTFEFEPKMLIMMGYEVTDTSGNPTGAIAEGFLNCGAVADDVTSGYTRVKTVMYPHMTEYTNTGWWAKGSTLTSSTPGMCKKSSDGKTVYWYAADRKTYDMNAGGYVTFPATPENQFNVLDKVYHYIAIGC